MKDHEKRELVNNLRDIALKYHATQQLREVIAHEVLPALEQARLAGMAQERALFELAQEGQRISWLYVPRDFDIMTWSEEAWEAASDAFSSCTKLSGYSEWQYRMCCAMKALFTYDSGSQPSA